MPLSNLLKSAAGTCPFCHQKAGILSREHPECRRAFQAGWHEMVQLAADAAGSLDFDEGHLRLTLSAVAKISYGNDDTVNQALEEGWKQGVAHSMADGIITQDEEARLREFRDQLALILQSQIRLAPFVMATPGSCLVAASPPRPVQDEIRRLVLCPYEVGQQPAHLGHCHGNQFFIRTVAAPFSPCSMA